MKLTSRRRTMRSRAAETGRRYLKLKAAGKAAKGTGKATRWVAVFKGGKAAARRTWLRWLPLAGAVGAAGTAVARRRRTAS